MGYKRLWFSIAFVILILCGCGREEVIQSNKSGEGFHAYIEYTKSLSYEQWEEIFTLPWVDDYTLAGQEGALSDDLSALGDRAEHGPYWMDNPLRGQKTEAPHFYLMAFRKLTAKDLEKEMDYTLLEGEIPSPDGKGQCLISEPLAELNHKSVGDVILLKNWLDPEKTVKVKITGIYKGPEGGEIMDERLKDSLADEPMNGIFVTVEDLKRLTHGAEREGVWRLSSLTLDEAASVDKVREEIENLGLSNSVKLYTAEELMDRMMGGGQLHEDSAGE